jgi:hypothetical protein
MKFSQSNVTPVQKHLENSIVLPLEVGEILDMLDDSYYLGGFCFFTNSLDYV